MTVSLKDYFAAVGSRFSDDDAKVIGPEMERLANERRATAKDIVSEARPEESPLHSYFEWDDSAAAELYRENQARHMAHSIKVRFIGSPVEALSSEPLRVVPTAKAPSEPIRLLHAVRPMMVNRDGGQVPRPGPKVYRTVEQLQSNPFESAQVIAEAKGALIGWVKRYKQYQTAFVEFGDTFQPIFEFVEQLERVVIASNE